MLRERQKLAMVVAEFLGTGILTVTALAVVSNLGNPVFVALGMALVASVTYIAFGSISGAHLNPAITLGLLSARRVQPLTAIVYIAAQLLGGMVAYGLFTYLTAHDIKTNNYFDSRILVSETVGAFVFALGWAAVIYNRLEAGKASFVIGASLASGVLCASFLGTGLVNPAVALGMHSWVWGTFALGPVLGAIIGFNLYALLFAPAATLVAEEKAAEAAVAEEPAVREPAAAKTVKVKRKKK